MLEYKFPKRQLEVDVIKTMTPEQVGRLKGIVKFRMEGLLQSCDDYFENLIESECHICQGFGYGYFDLPTGWGWLKGGSLLCNGCIDKWEKKFGEKPVINREGEIVYEHGTIPEDITSRGQADFGFTFG